MRSIPGPGRSLTITEPQSPCVTTTEPALWSPGSPTREGTAMRNHAPELEHGPRRCHQRKAHAATKTQHSRRKRVNISQNSKGWRHWNNISIFQNTHVEGLTLQSLAKTKEATATERAEWPNWRTAEKLGRSLSIHHLLKSLSTLL